MFCCQKTILRCGGKAGGAGTAVAAVDGRHFGVAAIGGSGVAGLHPFDFSSRPRASRHCGQVLRSADIKADGCDVFHRRGGASGATANKHGALAPKRGARTLMGGGGAERLASDTKPRRLAGGAGEAAAADRARSGQSWGAELGGDGAELTQRPNLHGWRCQRGGTSPKCRGGMLGRETGGGGAKLAAARSWRIARSCLKGFTPFRASQDR